MKIIHGDSRDVMSRATENSIDAIVTDPPYGLSFMGKKWDYDVPSVELWKEAYRVLKPGGYLLAFAGTRTYHRMAVNIEDAGFEVRDMIEWVYGSGFPKSLNIGKAVDKLQENEREVLGINQNTRPNHGNNPNLVAMNQLKGKLEKPLLTKGTSKWEGWGTALKPAHEPICMARKPLAEKTVAENCLKYGTGGINIDESRVGTETVITRQVKTDKDMHHNYESGAKSNGITTEHLGRFPANLIHDNSEEVRECFPETNGGSAIRKNKLNPYGNDRTWLVSNTPAQETVGYTDSGNASRFFKSIIYQAKASKSERNKGCDGLEEKTKSHITSQNFENALTGSGNERNIVHKNNHPTVKPIALMEYLIKMVTPKGGKVLDPFMGSGTTGVACKNLGYDFVGIELDESYVEIAKARIGNPIIK